PCSRPAIGQCDEPRFPYAEVEHDQEHWRRLDTVSLPDEDDRHVLAASLAAPGNRVVHREHQGLPKRLVQALGIKVLAPDQLLSRLVVEYEPQMLTVHRTAVASLSAPPTPQPSRRSEALHARLPPV